MDSTTELDPSTYQSLLGGASGSLFPESLVTTMIISFVVINILGLLFLVFYMINLIRNWKVQSAIFDIHKDLAELKAHIMKPEVAPVQSQPTKNDVIASEDTEPSTSA